MVSLFFSSLYSSCVFFLMIRRPPRSTLDRSSAASDVYKRQVLVGQSEREKAAQVERGGAVVQPGVVLVHAPVGLSLIHISEPTRPY